MKRREGRKTSFRGIKDLGNGLYRVRIVKKDPKTHKRIECDRKVKAKSVKEALAIKTRLENELVKGGRESKRLKRLGDAADVWLDEIVNRRHAEDPMQMHLCPSTRARFEASVRDFVKPFLGNFFSDRITREDVEDWRLVLLEQGYKRSTVNGHHRTLKAVLRTVGNSAAAKVKELNEKPDRMITRKQPNLLTASELDDFLAVARERWPQHYALMLVLFTTTMRISTALALRWEDLDLATMEFVVTRRLSGYGKKAVVVPGVKRDRFGEDSPPLLPEVHSALLTLKATYNEAQEASGLIFPAADGRHHYRTLLAKPFKDICKHACITNRFTPQGCRRTGAKLYGRTAGTRMAMDIAGHRTERMHQHYTPVDAEEKQAAARKAFGNLKLVGGTTVPDGGSGDQLGKSGDRGGDQAGAEDLAPAKSS